MPDDRRLTLIGAATILVVVFATWIVFLVRAPQGKVSPVEIAPAEALPAVPEPPSGETLNIQSEQAPVQRNDATGAATAPTEAQAPQNRDDRELTAAPSKPASPPLEAPDVTKIDSRTSGFPQDSTPSAVVESPALQPVQATDTIPGNGKPLFGWRSKRLVDSAEYRLGFRTGIIRDYGDMWSRGGCDWASVARGIRLSDYAISISSFENLTEVDNKEIRYRLEGLLQEELNEIAGAKGRVQTENVIFWASDGSDPGIGIEMIFRDPDGRVIAKLRHTAREGSAAEAAEEMAEVVADFIEDHEVIEP